MDEGRRPVLPWHARRDRGRLGDRQPLQGGTPFKLNPGEAYEQLHKLGRAEARWRRFFVHLGNDFLFMGHYLLLGATIAAAIRTFLPASVLTGLADRQVAYRQ